MSNSTGFVTGGKDVLPELTSQQAYKMPYVYPDLREAETLHQLFDSLQHLEQVANSVFGRVSARIATEKTKVNDIVGRMQDCQAAINNLHGTKRAVKVQSSARYPAPDKLADPTPMFQIGSTPAVVHKRHMYEARREVDYQDRLISAQDVRRLHADEVAAPPPQPLEGLGRLPAEIPSVSSLLLFNTSENPYRRYVNLDNLMGGERESKTGDREGGEDDLHAAPASLTTAAVPHFDQEKIGYVPKPAPLPQWSTPAVLPGLVGVADATWSADGVIKAINPSANQLPSLPAVQEMPVPQGEANPRLNAQDALNAAHAKATGAPTTSTATSANTTTATNNAPNAPPMPAVNMPTQSNNAPAIINPNAPPPPPPPPPPPAPPPPPPPPSGDGPKKSSTEKGESKGAASSGGGQEDILDAIRNIGRKGLKPAGKRRVPERAAAAPEPMDMMGELFATIARRRRGIGGTGGENENEGPTGGVVGESVGGGEGEGDKGKGEGSSDDEEWDD